MKKVGWSSILVAAILLAIAVIAEAQQPAKIPRIGYLSGSFASTSPDRREAFRQGLRELGYIEGKSILVEYRYADGKFDRLPALAAELVRLKVDIIVTAGPQATRPAKEVSSTIPIIMAQDPDPVGNGFVASLARPGGNITGLATFAPELSGKQLELLNETVPKLSRVAVFGTSINPGNAQNLREGELTAKAFGVKLQYLDVLSPKDIETAFRAASNAHAEAVLMLPGSVLGLQRAQLADLAAKNRLPAIYPQPEFTEAGGLMYYGANTPDLFRRAATYVDKILKGAKPGEGDSWKWYTDYTDAVKIPAYLAEPAVGYIRPLSTGAYEYDFVAQAGHKNIGAWIDLAAQKVGR